MELVVVIMQFLLRCQQISRPLQGTPELRQRGEKKSVTVKVTLVRCIYKKRHKIKS